MTSRWLTAHVLMEWQWYWLQAVTLPPAGALPLLVLASLLAGAVVLRVTFDI